MLLSPSRTLTLTLPPSLPPSAKPVSHAITPVRRGDNPGPGGVVVVVGGDWRGAALWVMSVDTCQKYSRCPEEAVCGVTAARPP